MATWNDVTEAAPELALAVKRSFDAHIHKTLVSADVAGNVLFSEVPKGEVRPRVKDLGSLTALAVSPDGKHFAVARSDGKVLIRMVPEGKKP